MKPLKRFALGFWHFIDKGTSFRRVCLGLYIIEMTVLYPLRIFGHFSEQMNVQLGTAAFLMLIPFLFWAIVDGLRTSRSYRREGKKLDADMKRLQIKSIVLDVLLELEFDKMTPEQRNEVMYKMPAGPKE